MGNHPASLPFLRAACALLLFAIFANPVLAQTTPPGVQISNVARVDYQLGALPQSVQSSQAIVVVQAAPSRATIQILRFAGGAPASSAGPTSCATGAGFVPLPPPAVAGQGNIDPLGAVPLADAPVVHAGDAVFLRLVDADRNLDAASLDVIELRVNALGTGDSERLRLTETGPNTGVFAGYVPSQLTGGAPAANCALDLLRDTEIEALYVDPQDASDAARDTGLIDPSGVIFDSTTGARVDGVRVRLVDAVSGAPATVLGDDGVSRFPSELITGQPATDSGGTVYSLPAGAFRFPLVAPGSYRLVIEVPAGYAAPSLAAPGSLATLPGGPYRIQAGSFGAPFDVLAPPGAALDVPIDPVSAALTLSKSTPATTTALGDVVEYTLRLANEDRRANARDVIIEDRLPVGLRLRAGTVQINGSQAADPQISADGRILQFAVPLVAAGRSVTIRYVVDVVPGATGRELVNTAQARATGGSLSNTASARLALREDFFRERAFVAGRVYRGTCGQPPTVEGGQAGVRVYLETGRYAVTDAGGRFHFEDLRPGTHVVQVDMGTVPEGTELERCAGSTRDAGRAYSRFVELRAGELEQVDFVLRELPPPQGTMQLALHSQAVTDNRFQHRVELNARHVSLHDVRVMIQLPDSFRLVDPAEAVNQGVWTRKVGELRAGETREFTFTTERVARDAVQPELRAIALYDDPAQPGQRTAAVVNRLLPGAPPPPPARLSKAQITLTPRFDVLGTELTKQDSATLARLARRFRGTRMVRATVAGHADSTPISPRARTQYADNLALSRARAEAVARWLQQAFDLPADAIAVEAYGDTRPLVEARDAASLARNRRVELELQYETLEQQVRAPEPPLPEAAPEQLQDQAQAQTVGAWKRARGAASDKAPNGPAVAAAARETAIDVEGLAPQFRWLAPAPEATPAIPSIKIALAHPYGTRVELSVNGWVVSDLNFDGTATDRANKVHLSRWRGIDLRDGENLLKARLIDPSDTVVETLERKIHYAGSAVRAELVKDRSRLQADGRERPEIVLRLFDAYGQPARPGTRGQFRIDAPYRSWWEVQQLDANPLLSAASEPQLEVGMDGLARIELEPTSQAGFAVLHLRFNERRDQELRVWLAPAARDFVMVGVASGTYAHNVLSRNLENSPALLAELAREGVEEGSSTQGRVSFFAKGRVRGDFLLTLAYDSARDRDAARARLKGIVEPDRYYLLYGDGTEPRDEAASGEKLYVKLERAQFVALFGDFDTGFTVTELARYNRSLTGFKTDYAGERVTATAFAARTDLGQARDEIAADGTSGGYRLSRAPIVVGSDKVRIEVRDRFNPERIVSAREQARFLDYRIDYDTGVLRFREPVLSRDRDLNPVTIVAEYETPGQGAESASAGVRATVRLGDSGSEVGATVLQDGSLDGDTRVAALDARWQIADATEARVEVARSESDDPQRATGANAWLAEVRHVDERFELKAYARSEDEGFGAGQQYSGLSGSRKIGADARWMWQERWILHAQVFSQDSLDTDAERQLAQAELRYQTNDRTFGLGVEHANDTGPDGLQRRSDVVSLSGSQTLFARRLTLRGTLAAPLGGNDDSVDYPARSVVGLDYNLPRATTLFAEWEHGSGGSVDTDMSRFGLRSRPFDRTQLMSSVTQQQTEYGPRVASNLGLTQGWQITDAWSVEAGVEQSNTLRGQAFVPQDPDLTLASGTIADDFTALFGGAQYHREDWTLAARLERRSADTEDRWVGTAGWYRAERGGHALSLVALFEQRDALSAEDQDQVDVRFAWAYRPGDRRWIVLNRLDLRRDARTGGLSEYETLKFVDNLHANWQWNDRTQLGLQLGLKRAISTLEAGRFAANSALLGLDLRRDLSPRFDLGLHASTLRNLTARSGMNQFGADIGFSPVRNMWVSVGYNFRGFDDRDFAGARAQHQGPYVQLRIKVDQDSFKDLSLDALRAPAMNSTP